MKRRIIEEVVDDVETNASGIVASTEPDTVRKEGLCIDALPLEVLHLVCRRLTRREVTDFRLVCRLFAVVGIEYLAEGAYVSFWKDSLEDLEALANTALSKRITSLFFVTEGMAGFFTYEEWLASMTLTQKDRRYLRFSSEAEKLEGYSIFKQKHEHIDTIIRERLYQRTLKTFFQNCPNLNALAISFAMGIWNFWHVDDEFGYTEASEKHLGPLSLHHRHHHSTIETAEIMQLVVQTGIQLQQLAVGYLPVERIQKPNPDLDMIKTAMQPLESLVLKVVNQPSVPSGPANDRGFFEYMDEDIRRVKEAADDLEEDLSAFIATAANLVHLRFGQGHEKEDRMVDGCLLRSLFDMRCYPNVFPSLRSLSLEFVDTSGQTLKNFLLARRDTISFVRLKDISLEDSEDDYSWTRFFQDMSNKMPKMELFLMYGTQRDTDGSLLEFGNTLDNQSSWKTHAMNMYLRNGGAMPVDIESASAQVLNPVMYREYPHRDHTSYISFSYIKAPEGFGSGLLEQFDDKFWAEHFWTFNPCC